MKREELRHLLLSESVKPGIYALDGDCGDEMFCMQRSAGGWVVYFSERGSRNRERFFTNEEEAYDYLASLILPDPTTRLKPRAK